MKKKRIKSQGVRSFSGISLEQTIQKALRAYNTIELRTEDDVDLAQALGYSTTNLPYETNDFKAETCITCSAANPKHLRLFLEMLETEIPEQLRRYESDPAVRAPWIPER